MHKSICVVRAQTVMMVIARYDIGHAELHKK